MSAVRSALATFARAHELDLASRYLKGWEFGKVVERAPGESFSRERMWEQVSAKAAADGDFRRELLRNPRLVMMMGVREGLGISGSDFLRQVDEVQVVEESAATLYLVIPACHKGCEAPGVVPAPDASGPGRCHVCGMTMPAGRSGCASGASAPAAVRDNGVGRGDIERSLTERVAGDRALRKRLVAEPLATYREYARELNGGELPAYLHAVGDIRVCEETERLLVFVLPGA
jgi:hypothetical protein